MSVTNVNIPTAQSFVLVDTRTGPNKVLFLPAASTIQGRFLSIKDYYGGATASSMTISTTGFDRIDQRGIYYTLASSFGSVALLSDGIRSWNMMGLYEGGDTALSTMSGVVSNGAVTATGGTITTNGSYKIHTFTAGGTFTLTSPTSITAQVLVVGGGGGGGTTYCGGGGGAGGAVYNGSFTIASGSFTVTVGTGGAGASGYLTGGTSGTNTTFSTLTGYGGGGGGSDNPAAGGASAQSGGCGGGAGYGGSGGSGTQGYGGSVGERINSVAKAGGGGGMGSAGAISGGGNGLSYTVGGVTATYAAGGGGGTSDIAGATIGPGGSSGLGGSGATQSVAATSPTANTGSGGGGGGGGSYPAGTRGADGVVIIAYSTIIYTTWKYVRFTLVLTRGQYSGIFQISEFTLKYQGSVVSYTGASITPVVGGAEGTANIIDGILSNKAFNIGSYFTIYRDSGFLFNAYTWGTANDVPDRDPVRWIVDASQDNATWTVLDNKSTADQTITTSRNTYVQDFTF